MFFATTTLIADCPIVQFLPTSFLLLNFSVTLEGEMILKCQCCGFEAKFTDGEAAFEAGWDAPPHFTGYVCCNLCPAVCVVLRLPHEAAHAMWAREGRPVEFSVAKCGCDDDIARLN
jgi:hypothetical protein